MMSDVPPPPSSGIHNATRISAIDAMVADAAAKARRAFERKLAEEREAMSATLDEVERRQDSRILKSQMDVKAGRAAPATGAIKRVSADAKAEARRFLASCQATPVPGTIPPPDLPLG